MANLLLGLSCLSPKTNRSGFSSLSCVMSTYSLQNGRAVLAPYSLRKLEAYLLANGFDESE
jgi:hypothetical protein